MRTLLPRVLGLGLGAVLGLGSVACSNQSDGAGNTQMAEDERPVAVAADLDRYHAGDMTFYDSLRLDGGLLARPPANVTAAAKGSTAVVVARIQDVAPARVIGDLQTVGINLDVVEVLNGKLRPELADKVVVEYPLGEPSNVDTRVAALREALPKGDAIWFLRWQGDKRPVTKPEVTVNSDPADPRFYSLLHMHAMFIQGPKKVINPFGEHDAESRSLPGLQADGEKFTKMSELAQHIRTA